MVTLAWFQLWSRKPMATIKYLTEPSWSIRNLGQYKCEDYTSNIFHNMTIIKYDTSATMTQIIVFFKISFPLSVWAVLTPHNIRYIPQNITITVAAIAINILKIGIKAMTRSFTLSIPLSVFICDGLGKIFSISNIKPVVVTPSEAKSQLWYMPPMIQIMVYTIDLIPLFSHTYRKNAKIIAKIVVYDTLGQYYFFFYDSISYYHMYYTHHSHSHTGTRWWTQRHSK